MGPPLEVSIYRSERIVICPNFLIRGCNLRFRIALIPIQKLLPDILQLRPRLSCSDAGIINHRPLGRRPEPRGALCCSRTELARPAECSAVDIGAQSANGRLISHHNYRAINIGHSWELSPLGPMLGRQWARRENNQPHSADERLSILLGGIAY